MDLSIIKVELENLYGISVKNIEKIVRTDRRTHYKIIAEEGKFFLKTYEVVNLNIIEGLKLLDYLISKGFPAVKVFKSKRGNYIEIISNTPVALFEWVDVEDGNINLKKSKNLGRALGLLHKLTEDYDFPENKNWGNTIYTTLTGLYKYKRFVDKNAPSWFKKIYYKVLERLEKWVIPEDVPKSVLHGKFTYEHVFFKGDEVYKVIDWDPANKGWRFQDLGITLFDMIHFNSEEHMYACLEGYKEARSLTEWEEKNLNNILLFGLGTFLWWLVSDIINGNFSWDYLNKEVAEKIINDKFFL